MSVRIRQGNDIFYFQPTPPPAMHQHFGWWRLSQHNGTTSVASDHSLEINLERAAEFLRTAGIEAEGDDQVRQRFCEVIHHNSKQTMMALKARLEGRNGGADAH
jgi:aromatase